MRIGLLLPSSNYIPRLAKDIRQSIQLALDETGATGFELVVETSSYNEQALKVREKIQDLAVKSDVDVIIAPLNPGMIDNIADLLSAQEVPLIALSMGEDVVQGEIVPPWVFHNSMSLWRSIWMSGYHSVKKNGPKASIIIGAHESGYDLANAAQLGIRAAGGAEASIFPCPVNVDAQSVRDRFDWALEEQSDFIVALGCGDVAQYFSDTVAEKKIETPIVGIAPIQYGFDNIPAYLRGSMNCSFSTWNAVSEDSKAYIETFSEQFDKPAHVYGLLAFEAGRLLGTALQNMSGPISGNRLCSALKSAEFKGPRGMMRFDPETQEIITKQVQLTFGEAVSETSVSAPETLSELAVDVANCRENSDKRGWLNPYLIA